MSEPYQVIARRYRPRKFSEVVGQDATAEALRQAVLGDRLAHAYLFCGPRGVGKTSMARIFARVLECPDAKDGDPCDRCATCERIFRGEDLDVVEMDGASHRGIDDVRDLIQHARYVPNSGPYRIFIIDEVHMLTREAFNALLKTLEEPPAHVKFIFCTTEPEKIPTTVLSRCQRFDVAAISAADIVQRLAQICEAEGATPEDGLLERVADLARGGMRDSQSLLDQLLSFAGSQPTLEDLDRLTGRLSPAAIAQLLELLEAGDRAALISELDGIALGGNDPAVLLEQLAEEYRQQLHSGVAAGQDDVATERQLLAQEILQEARLKMRQLGRADIVLEMALLRIATLADLIPLAQWRDVVAGGAGAPAGPPAAPPSRKRERRAAPETREPPPADSGLATEPAPRASVAQTPSASATARADTDADRDAGGGDIVARVRAHLAELSALVARFVGDGVVVEGDTVALHMNGMAARQFDARKRDSLREALNDDLGRRLRIEVVVTDAAESGTAAATQETATQETASQETATQETAAAPEPSPPETRSAPAPEPAAGAGGGGGGAASPGPATPGPGGTLPGIVEKAIELFQGSLHGSSPPPRPGP